MEQSEALRIGLIKALSHLPTIYNQRTTQNWNGEYIIHYPFSEVPNNTILLMLPLYNALAEGSNKLTIKYATVSGPDSVEYTTSKTYNILVEGHNGRKRPATKGDIIANRLCIFRFITNNPNDVVLCNNPIYGDLVCSTLNITNEARFYERPKHVYTTQDGSERETTLATTQELEDLKTRLANLENRLHVGTESPETFFETNQDLPKNTIYFQTEV